LTLISNFYFQVRVDSKVLGLLALRKVAM